MKVLLKSLFLAITLSIIAFSAVAADAVDVIVDDTTAVAVRRCCTYQEDCLNTQTCVTIDPACSADKKNICKKNATSIEPAQP